MADDSNSGNARAAAFSLRRLRWELGLDRAIRWGVIGLLLGVVVLSSGGWLGPWGASAVGLGVMGCWVVWGLGHAALLHRVRMLPAVIEADPAAAEAQLAVLLRRRGLGAWARLMLYQSLASVRFGQGRFVEVALIGGALHPRNLGPGEAGRVTLMLLTAEARLNCADLPGAWQTLCILHALRVSLEQAAQRLALSTRYQVAAGLDASALWQLESKLSLLDLLPPTQAGQCHQWLAQSAERTKKPRLGAWLTERGRLLSGV